jgi:hypothetical protein
VTMHFRCALRDHSTALDPLTCMFSSECGIRNQNSAATSGNALTPTFLTCTLQRGRASKCGVDAFPLARTLFWLHVL